MALVVKDRVKETTTTTGTGTLTLAGSSSGYQSFAAIGNGNSTYYVITDVTSGAWEVGIGTYTASGTTLSRDTVLSSSNAGSLVSFGAGVKDVFVAYPSERAVYLDSAGSYPVQSTFGTLTATTANLTNGTVSSAPSSGTDITNKTYVDTVATTAIDFHEPVRGEVPNTTGNLTATYNNGTAGVGATLTNAGTQATFAYGGVSWNLNDRVLIYNQTNAVQNGVYTITNLGSGSTNWVLTRATDADSYSINDPQTLDQGSSFFIQEGDGAGETYACNTPGVITFGTTNITFTQISSSQVYSAGTGLTLTGTQFSITNTGTAGTYGSASAVPVLTTNAQGQVTSVTNTTIAIAGSQVSGAISGQAGSVANSLTLGTYLTGGSFNGSSPVTATVDATSANTASKVVARDASGNFSAGTITASLSGNATTATTSTNLAGGAANQIPYQTASGTTSFITAASGTDYVLNFNGSTFTWVAGTISGVPLGSNLSSLSNGAYLTWSSGTNFNGSAASTLAVDATSANTASKVVARDASGNFSAGTITATLSGNATTATTATTANALNTANSYTVAGLTLNNGLVDGAGVVFNSQGFTSWEIDNSSGALRFFQPGTTYGSWTTSGLTVTGSVTATAFSGSGASLTSLNASNLSSGTVPDARITGSYTGMTNLTGSGTVDFAKFLGNAADTAALPSFSWTGDTNTGIYTPGADQIGISTGGTSRLTVSTTAIASTLPISASTFTGALSGNATTATTLQTARTINGVSFNGSANITVESYIEDDEGTNATRYLTFVDNTTAAFKRLNEDSSLTYNPSTNVLTAGTFSGALTGNVTGYVSGAKFSNDSETKDDITTRTESGFWQSASGTTAEGWPLNSGTWQHLLSTTHSNDANYYAMQFAASFYENDVYYRSTNGSGTTAWSKILLDTNISSYAAKVNAGGAVVENKQTVTGTTTMTAGSNGMSVGPITISSGASFTVGSGQRWVIL